MLPVFRSLMFTVPLTAFVVVGFSACAPATDDETVVEEAEAVEEAATDVAADLVGDWNSLKNRMVTQAEAMPAELYEYKPTEELRNFAEQLMHITGAQNNTMGTLNAAMEAPARPEETGDKAAVIQAMIDSFDYGAAVLASETSDSIHDVIECSYLGTSTKARCVYSTMVHTWSEYGVMTVYHRLNDLVPPASQ